MKKLLLFIVFVLPPLMASQKQNLNGPQLLPSNKNGDTPLHVATKQHNLPLVKSLVESKANVDEPNDEGLSALDIARDCCYFDKDCKEDYLNNMDIYLYLFQSRFEILQTTIDSLSLCCEDGDNDDEDEVVKICPCDECEDCEYCEEDGK